MSDFLERLTARSRGTQSSGIRPAPNPAMLWGTTVEDGEKTIQRPRPDAHGSLNLGPQTTPKEARGRRSKMENGQQPADPASAVTTTDITVSPRPSSEPASPGPMAAQPIQGAPPPAETGTSSSLKATAVPEPQPPAADSRSAVPPLAPSLSPGNTPPAPLPLRPVRKNAKPEAPVPQAPTVEISIGAIEVGVLPPTPPPPGPPPRRRPAVEPRLSLDTYLRRRNRKAAGGLP